MKKKSPIPERLKEAREAAGTSQRRLGISAGIDEFSASARMNQYEKGKYTPDFGTLSKIAKVLQLPPPYFYAEDNRLAEIIKLYQQITDTEKEYVLSFLKQRTKQPFLNLSRKIKEETDSGSQ